MPELPEAETIAVELNRRLARRRLGCVRVARADIVHGDPRPLGTLLRGRRVERVYRRAKRVILQLEPQAELIFRLGMTGRLTLAPTKHPIEPHTHLRIAIPALGHELRFRDPRRFGGVWCLTGHTAHVGKTLGEIGPEPLQMRSATFGRILGDRRRQIKALLLDQRMIVGLGNIYCDEALHAAGIHPLTRSDTLGEHDTRRLLRAIKATLRKAIRHNGSTLTDYRQADGSEGSFQRLHRVYGRDGKPCRNCGTAIMRIKVSGRSSHLCPTCQPSP
jgi:formamidopyrimidine-DNA glycosylase